MLPLGGGAVLTDLFALNGGGGVVVGTDAADPKPVRHRSAQLAKLPGPDEESPCADGRGSDQARSPASEPIASSATWHGHGRSSTATPLTAETRTPWSTWCVSSCRSSAGGSWPALAQNAGKLLTVGEVQGVLDVRK